MFWKESVLRTSISVRLVAIVAIVFCYRLQTTLVFSSSKSVSLPPPLNRKCTI